MSIPNYDQRIEQWYKPENFESIDDHDCHLSPEDSCDCINASVQLELPLIYK